MVGTAALAQAQLKTKPFDAVQATYDRAIENDPALKARIETIRQAVSNHALAPIETMISGGYVALSCTTAAQGLTQLWQDRFTERAERAPDPDAGHVIFFRLLEQLRRRSRERRPAGSAQGTAPILCLRGKDQSYDHSAQEETHALHWSRL